MAVGNKIKGSILGKDFNLSQIKALVKYIDTALDIGSGGSSVYGSANRQAAQSIDPGSWTAVSFDTQDSDSGDLFTLAAPTYITVPDSGFYNVAAMVPWLTSPNATGNRGITIRKNDTVMLSGSWEANSEASKQQSCAWGGWLTAGDKLSLYVFSSVADSVRTASGNGAAFLSASKV